MRHIILREKMEDVEDETSVGRAMIMLLDEPEAVVATRYVCWLAVMIVFMILVLWVTRPASQPYECGFDHRTIRGR
jgi:hypothetical protein